jgi:hypothetical protein
VQAQAPSRSSTLAGPADPSSNYAIPRSQGDDEQQHAMHVAVRCRLPRSGRVWSFGNAVSNEETDSSEDTASSDEYDKFNDL